MKKHLFYIGAVFLMALCTLPALAALDGTGYYRVRNAAEGQTNQYMSFANDIINFTNIIHAPGGAENLGTNPQVYVPLAMSCVDAYLKNDIHLIEPDFIDPATVIYIKLQNSSSKTYNLIAQGTSLLTLTTGIRYGSRGNVYFENLYAIIKDSGSANGATLYTAYLPLKVRASIYGIFNTNYTLGNSYFEDKNGTFSVLLEDSIATFTNNFKWYIEPLTYFNVRPEVALNGKYFTTLKVPFQCKLDGNDGSSVEKAYVITGVNADGELQYQELTSRTIPAGTPVLLECSSSSPADCKLYFISKQTTPLFTAPNSNASAGESTNWNPSVSSVEGANESSDYDNENPGVNKLKGTYYCNTDGTMYYNTTSGVNKGYFYGNHYTDTVGLYELGIDSNGKVGFVKAQGITTPQNIQAMPANKAWMEQGGIFRSAEAPTITPASSTSTSPIEVTITCENDATIHYTTDGSDPTWESPEYTEPITLNESATVKAIAIMPGLYNPSDVVSESYTINLLNPTLSVEPTSLIINDSGTNNSFTVIGENLVDDIGLSRSTDIFNHTLAATEGTTDSGVYNGNPWWAFRKSSDNKVNGTVTVSYPGRELTATGTFTVGTKKVSGGEDITETVTVTYQPDIYLYGDFGNGWKCGDQMSYSNGEYSATITTTGNTYLLFARKAVSDNSYGWNTDRLFFGANTNGDNWLYVNNTTDDLDVNANVNGQYHPIEIKLEDAGKFIITINAQSKKFTITKIPESTLAYIESNGVVGNAYTVTDELIGVWAVNNDNDKLLWAKDQGNVSIDKRPAKTDDQTDYMVTHMKYQHYPWEGYDWDESNWVILDFGDLNDNPESYVGHKLMNKSISGIYSDANNYTIKLSDAPIYANRTESSLDAPDYPGYAGVHDESNYGTKYAWAYNTYMPANFNEANLNRLENGVVVGAQSGPNALANMQNQLLYFMNPKIMEVAHLWGVWDGNGRFVILETSFDGSQTINAWDLHGAVDVLSWDYNRKGQYEYGEPNELEEGKAQDFHALILRKPASNKLTSDASSGTYGIIPLDMPQKGHPTAVKELTGNRVVKSTSYYNVMGMESSKPFEGINIVVTRYSDGSSTTTKVLH